MPLSALLHGAHMLTQRSPALVPALPLKITRELSLAPPQITQASGPLLLCDAAIKPSQSASPRSAGPKDAPSPGVVRTPPAVTAPDGQDTTQRHPHPAYPKP